MALLYVCELGPSGGVYLLAVRFSWLRTIPLCDYIAFQPFSWPKGMGQWREACITILYPPKPVSFHVLQTKEEGKRTHRQETL